MFRTWHAARGTTMRTRATGPFVRIPKAQAAAQDNGIRLIYIPAPRGQIVDRNGNILVGNVNVPVIEVSRQTASLNPDMVSRLAPLLGMTVVKVIGLPYAVACTLRTPSCRTVV